MTKVRLGILAIVCVLLGVALTLGLQRLTSGGTPIPIDAPVSFGATGSPSATRSTLGLPDRSLTPGAINPAATQDNLDLTVCKPGCTRRC